MILLVIFGILGLFQVYQGWQTHRTVKILHDMQADEITRGYIPEPRQFGFVPAVADPHGDMTERNPAPE